MARLSSLAEKVLSGMSCDMLSNVVGLLSISIMYVGSLIFLLFHSAVLDLFL